MSQPPFLPAEPSTTLSLPTSLLMTHFNLSQTPQSTPRTPRFHIDDAQRQQYTPIFAKIKNKKPITRQEADLLNHLLINEEVRKFLRGTQKNTPQHTEVDLFIRAYGYSFEEFFLLLKRTPEYLRSEYLHFVQLQRQHKTITDLEKIHRVVLSDALRLLNIEHSILERGEDREGTPILREINHSGPELSNLIDNAYDRTVAEVNPDWPMRDILDSAYLLVRLRLLNERLTPLNRIRVSRFIERRLK